MRRARARIARDGALVEQDALAVSRREVDLQSTAEVIRPRLNYNEAPVDTATPSYPPFTEISPHATRSRQLVKHRFRQGGRPFVAATSGNLLRALERPPQNLLLSRCGGDALRQVARQICKSISISETSD